MWKLVRIWILSSWSFLTIGILLGSWWAYHELGWGGWWFWDPVENASLMPWLLATACIHSITKPKLNYWTLICTQATFILSILGTFFVRSGLLSSVHSFATDSTRGLYLLLFLLSITSISVFNWISLCFNTSQYERLSAISQCSPPLGTAHRGDFRSDEGPRATKEAPLGRLALRSQKRVGGKHGKATRPPLATPTKPTPRGPLGAAEARSGSSPRNRDKWTDYIVGPHRGDFIQGWTALFGSISRLCSLRKLERSSPLAVLADRDNGAIRRRELNIFSPANRATTPVFLKKQSRVTYKTSDYPKEPPGSPRTVLMAQVRSSGFSIGAGDFKRSLEQILFLQNFYLCYICIVVFCGTSAPLFFHWLWNRDVGTGAPFYNALCIPLFTSVFFVLVYAHYIQFNISNKYPADSLRSFVDPDAKPGRPSLLTSALGPNPPRTGLSVVPRTGSLPPRSDLVCANSRQSSRFPARRPIKPSSGSPGDTLLFLYCIFFFFLHVLIGRLIGLNFLDSIYGAICFLLISSIIISSKKIPNSGVSETFMTYLSSLPSRHIVLTPKLRFGHQPSKAEQFRLFQFESGRLEPPNVRSGHEGGLRSEPPSYERAQPRTPEGPSGALRRWSARSSDGSADESSRSRTSHPRRRGWGLKCCFMGSAHSWHDAPLSPARRRHHPAPCRRKCCGSVFTSAEDLGSGVMSEPLIAPDRSSQTQPRTALRASLERRGPSFFAVSHARGALGNPERPLARQERSACANGTGCGPTGRANARADVSSLEPRGPLAFARPDLGGSSFVLATLAPDSGRRAPSTGGEPERSLVGQEKHAPEGALGSLRSPLTGSRPRGVELRGIRGDSPRGRRLERRGPPGSVEVARPKVGRTQSRPNALRGGEPHGPNADPRERPGGLPSAEHIRARGPNSRLAPLPSLPSPYGRWTPDGAKGGGPRRGEEGVSDLGAGGRMSLKLGGSVFTSGFVGPELKRGFRADPGSSTPGDPRAPSWLLRGHKPLGSGVHPYLGWGWGWGTPTPGGRPPGGVLRSEPISLGPRFWQSAEGFRGPPEGARRGAIGRAWGGNEPWWETASAPGGGPVALRARTSAQGPTLEGPRRPRGAETGLTGTNGAGSDNAVGPRPPLPPPEWTPSGAGGRREGPRQDSLIPRSVRTAQARSWARRAVAPLIEGSVSLRSTYANAPGPVGVRQGRSRLSSGRSEVLLRSSRDEVQMNVAHTGIVLFIIGILLSNTFKFEFTEQLHSGPSGIRLGSQICCLRSIDHSFAPTYHSICANLLVYQQVPPNGVGRPETERPLRPDGRQRLAHNMKQVLELVRSGQRSDGETSACAVCMFPEKRFYYSNQARGPGGLATKVAIHSNLFTDFYSLIGTGSFETGWFTTIMKLPFIFCIWLGFMFGVIGGFFSLKKQLQKSKLYWL